MYEIEFEVPGRSPSGNVVSRWHWTKRRAHVLATYQAVMVAFMETRHPKPEKPLKRARIEITSVRSKLLDVDRLYGGLTAYLDALQRPRVTRPAKKGRGRYNPRGTVKPGIGLIYDDNPASIDYVARQRVGFPERVIVRVVDVGESA